LLERNPPVADIETLLYLEEFSISEGQLGPLGTRWGQMWQRAAASRPQDEKLHMQWYQVKFDAGDLKASQQVQLAILKAL